MFFFLRIMFWKFKSLVRKIACNWTNSAFIALPETVDSSQSLQLRISYFIFQGVGGLRSCRCRTCSRLLRSAYRARTASTERTAKATTNWTMTFRGDPRRRRSRKYYEEGERWWWWWIDQIRSSDFSRVVGLLVYLPLVEVVEKQKKI